MEIDCYDLINAHVVWKQKLKSAIATGHALNTTKIGRHDCCPLGEWLQSEAKEKFGHLATYSQCVGAHAIFHREAGKVAELVNSRSVLEAEAAMSPTGAFEIASYRLKSAIHRLARDVNTGSETEALAD